MLQRVVVHTIITHPKDVMVNHTNICGKLVFLKVMYHLYVTPGCIHIKVTRLSKLSGTLNLVILAF